MNLPSNAMLESRRRTDHPKIIATLDISHGGNGEIWGFYGPEKYSRNENMISTELVATFVVDSRIYT